MFIYLLSNYKLKLYVFNVLNFLYIVKLRSEENS